MINKYLIIICLLICGCTVPERQGKTIEETSECSGVIIDKWDSGIYELRNKDENIYSISRTPEDWERIINKIHEIEISPEKNEWKNWSAYTQTYRLSNDLKYTINNSYFPTGNDSAFLYLYYQNIELKNKLNIGKVITPEKQ